MSSQVLLEQTVYANILNTVPAGISIAIDVSCTEIRHNPVAAEFLRIQPWDNFSHSSANPPAVKILHQGQELLPEEMPMQVTARQGKEIKDCELEFVWEDGVRKTALWNCSPLFDDQGAGTGAVATFKEITVQSERMREQAAANNKLIAANEELYAKRPEGEMDRLERLSLLGEMAAGIAHEIRNPMTVVKGYLQLLQAKKEYAPDRQHLKVMIDELDRATAIITEFLSLARNASVELKRDNLNSILEALFPLIMADAMKAGKEIGLKLGNIPQLDLDQRQIRQLVLNLTRNGLESMPPNGILTISTYLEGGRVVLAVQDQGAGIDPAILDKLGTPFVTTKEQGTGLGLAVCYRIAERHNAKIDVQTGAAGTTFMIVF